MNKVIFALLGAGILVGCQASSRVPLNSGIELTLSSPDGEPPLRPDGAFRIEGLDARRRVLVPLTPVDPESAAQRIELPPGRYKVSYVPIQIEPSLSSLHRREAVLSSSPADFVVKVSQGKFSTVNVHAIDAASTTASRDRLTRRRLDQPQRSRGATASQPSPRSR
jgi:hypothetical protein